METIKIFTDGSARLASDKVWVSGSAAVAVQDGLIIGVRHSSDLNSTNNTAELKAILMAIELTNNADFIGKRVYICADSEYSINMISKALAGEEIDDNAPNRELVLYTAERLNAARARCDISFKKVVAHTNVKYNEFADDLSKGEMIKLFKAYDTIVKKREG